GPASWRRSRAGSWTRRGTRVRRCGRGGRCRERRRGASGRSAPSSPRSPHAPGATPASASFKTPRTRSKAEGRQLRRVSPGFRGATRLRRDAPKAGGFGGPSRGPPSSSGRDAGQAEEDGEGAHEQAGREREHESTKEDGG